MSDRAGGTSAAAAGPAPSVVAPVAESTAVAPAACSTRRRLRGRDDMGPPDERYRRRGDNRAGRARWDAGVRTLAFTSVSGMLRPTDPRIQDDDCSRTPYTSVRSREVGCREGDTVGRATSCYR